MNCNLCNRYIKEAPIYSEDNLTFHTSCLLLIKELDTKLEFYKEVIKMLEDFKQKHPNWEFISRNYEGIERFRQKD